jgi:hypothetical protein
MEGQWQQELRDMKIDIVSGERKIEICDKVMAKFTSELRFIAKELPDDIITGSLALNLYGLIERDINDIDIIIDSRFRYSGYSSGKFYGSPNDGDMIMENRLGYIYFEDEVKSGAIKRFFGLKSTVQRKVDFFENTGNTHNNYFEFEGHKYRIQEPMSIVEAKCQIEKNCVGRIRYQDLMDDGQTQKEKHNRDLERIFNKNKR